MCEPVTIALAATAVVGGVMQADAAKKQGAEAKRQGRYSAQMAEYAARDATRRGQEQAAAIDREGRKLQGEQRAAAAGAGLTAGYGTLGEAEAQADFFSELDRNTALDDAARDALAARTQGAEAIRSGNAAAKQANRSANAILLNTAGSLAARWAPAASTGYPAGSSLTVDRYGYGIGTNYGQSLPTRGGA
jgi:hypothetical protein